MPAEAEPTPQPRTRRPANHLPAEDAGTIARLAARARSFKDALKRARVELAQTKRDVQARDAAISELQPLADGSKAKELQAQLTTLKHRGRFDVLAGELGVKPGALDDLYALSGYQAEGDPDDAKIREAIEAQKAPRSYLFGEATPVQEATAAAPVVLPAGPGASRGGSPAPAPKRFTKEQLGDPIFVMQNAKAIQAQAKENLERGLAG